MIKYVWLIILIVYGSCLAQPEDTVNAILQSNTAPQLRSSGFSSGLRFSASDQLSSSRSRKSRDDFIAKSRLWAAQIQQQEIIEQACIHASATQIAEFFEQCRSQGIFSDTQLLTWYPLYQLSSYRIYVKGLQNYETHVTQLHHHMSGNKKTQKKVAKQMALTLESAQKLINHLWNELLHDRAVAKAREQMQRAAQEALRVKQEQFQTIKIAQEQVLQTQAPLLENCRAQWKIQAQERDDNTSTRYTHRIRAINSDSWCEQTYQINTHVNKLLTQQNISPDSYVKLYGNELQHTLHSEFLSILDRVALNNQPGSQDKFVKKLNQYAVECTDIGCAYNTEGAVAYASMIADIGWNVLDLTSAITEAIRDATINTADLVMHPLATLQAIHRSVFYFVVSTGDGLLYKDTNYQRIPANRQEVIAAYNAIGQELVDTARQMKARDWVKGAVCFATECLLQAKLINMLTSVCKGAGKYALRCAQIIESSLPEAKAVVTGIEGVSTEVKLCETIAQVVT